MLKRHLIEFKINESSSLEKKDSNFMVVEMLLAPCAEFKFLGVTIDDRLKFDAHVVCKKVSSVFF